jgi:hypothetical protein
MTPVTRSSRRSGQANLETPSDNPERLLRKAGDRRPPATDTSLPRREPRLATASSPPMPPPRAAAMALEALRRRSANAALDHGLAQVHGSALLPLAAAGTNSGTTQASPTMEPLAHVQDVLDTVRNRIYKSGLKSSNKHTPDKVGDRNRANDAEDELRYMRREMYPVAAALNGRAHNCGQLVDIASELLRTLGFFVSSHSSRPAADHVVAICSKEPLPSLSPDKGKWPDGVFICDPWANIACRSNDYPDEFRTKMAKWSQGGKKVWVAPADDAVDAQPWIDPSDPHWVDAVAGVQS